MVFLRCQQFQNQHYNGYVIFVIDIHTQANFSICVCICRIRGHIWSLYCICIYIVFVFVFVLYLSDQGSPLVSVLKGDSGNQPETHSSPWAWRWWWVGRWWWWVGRWWWRCWCYLIIKIWEGSQAEYSLVRVWAGSKRSYVCKWQTYVFFQQYRP